MAHFTNLFFTFFFVIILLACIYFVFKKPCLESRLLVTGCLLGLFYFLIVKINGEVLSSCNTRFFGGIWIFVVIFYLSLFLILAGFFILIINTVKDHKKSLQQSETDLKWQVSKK